MNPSKITFLGTGTSTGIPQIGCHCAACMSTDPHDKRLRASVIIEVGGRNILIDAGPDLRTQLLRAGSPSLEALLVTHSHYDHIGGIIDLRAYSITQSFPVYCQADVARDLRAYFPYCFAKDLYRGVPTYTIHVAQPGQPFHIDDIEIMPLQVMHGRLPILGFRIGNFAYITDAKTISDDVLLQLMHLDTLVINALRIEQMPSHLTLHETLDIVARVKPRRAFLTHMSHDMGPEATVQLPPGVSFAYDMLTVEL